MIQVNILIFQTGTLTEDGLDMWGVVPVKEGRMDLPIRDVAKMANNQLLQGMATCHSLTLIEGVISGDPLDVKVHNLYIIICLTILILWQALE